jgi:hypothetical protein
MRENCSEADDKGSRMRTDLSFDQDALWSKLHAETVALAAGEPFLASFLHATVINHRARVIATHPIRQAGVKRSKAKESWPASF